MRLSEFAVAVKGKINKEGTFSSISTDTRTLSKDALFVALKGERVDGHNFITQAVAKGASCLLVNKLIAIDIPQLIVEDTQLALGDMARFWRQQFSLPVISITGSCGKTTVKTMIGTIMRKMGPTCITEGNLNTEIGLPLNVLRLDNHHRYAVFEMGAGKSGDIAYLTKIAVPSVALITTIAPAHMKSFGTLEDIAKGKGEAYEALPKDGICIINADEPYGDLWRKLAGDKKIITYGLMPTADFSATDIELAPLGATFTLKYPGSSVKVRIKMPGIHSVRNALGAAAATFAAGATMEVIVEGLNEMEAVKGRLAVEKGCKGSNVIDDTYNANPGSVNAAIEVLARFPGKRILILGNMLELGEKEATLHEEIGKHAVEAGIDILFSIGDLAQHATKAAGAKAEHFPSQEALVAKVLPLLDHYTTVLVKGSRGMQMEKIVNALKETVHAC